MAGLALVPVLGLLVEAGLIRFGWMPYFSAGFPLLPEVVPIRVMPTEAGKAGSVSWDVPQTGWVRWWSNPDAREALTGLHGVVWCVRRGERVHLHMRWSPPWSPLLAAAGLLILGVARGLSHVTAPVSVAMVLGLMVLYHQGALRAAGELRFGLSGALPSDDSPRVDPE